MENRFRPRVEEPAETASAQSETKQTNHKKTDRELFPPLKFLRQLLDGSLLANETVVRNIPFILFLTGLAILYITNSTTAEKNRRELARLTEEVKELRYKYISTKSGVMFLSNQSQISQRLKETEIRESTVPPVKIFIKKTSGSK